MLSSDHRQGQAESNRGQGHEHRGSQEEPTIATTGSAADDLDLQDQRDLHANHDEENKDDAQDGSGIGGNRDSGKVLGQQGVDLNEWGGEIDNLADQAGDVEEQGKAIQPENGRVAFFAAAQEDKHCDQDDRGSELAAIVDADADAVLELIVYAGQGHGHRSTISTLEGDILFPKLVIRSHNDSNISGYRSISMLVLVLMLMP